VVVPGTEGDFGVLEGHAPVMSTVRDGAIQVFRTAGGTPENIEVRGGFSEVGENGLTVRAEHVEGCSSSAFSKTRARSSGCGARFSLPRPSRW
jgi:F-type H+-transporting ATPase subunit epsilon